VRFERAVAAGGTGSSCHGGGKAVQHRREQRGAVEQRFRQPGSVAARPMDVDAKFLGMLMSKSAVAYKDAPAAKEGALAAGRAAVPDSMTASAIQRRARPTAATMLIGLFGVTVRAVFL
jgi:hypothetical protein